MLRGISIQRQLTLIVALIAAATCLYGLGDIALLSINEGRRAVPIKEMLASGNWLLPQLNGELYITKPPLYYWLGAIAGYLLNSASEWAVRMPSALVALATLAACYRYMKRHHGAWPALFCLAILVANEGFSGMARRAELEMLLAGCCSGALLAALHFIQGGGDRRWVYLSYALLGLAILTKGPVALLFVTLPLAATAIHYRQPRAIEYFRCLGGWVLFLAIGLSWYLAVSLKLGFGIWHQIVSVDMADKITGAQLSEPVYSYPVWVLGAFMPAILLLFRHPRETFGAWLKRPEEGALLYAFALPFIIFTLIADKHAKYLLPAYPALAMLLALRLDALHARLGERWQRAIIGAIVALPAAFMIFYGAAEKRIYTHRVEAPAKVQAMLEQYPADLPVYSHLLLDARVYYYISRHVPTLDNAGLDSLTLRAERALVLSEHPLPESKQRCLLQQINPYFKRKKTLQVYGTGAMCPAEGSPAPTAPQGI